MALALIYQILSRRFGWRVIAYWALIFAGFMGAEFFAESLGWNVTRLGDLRIMPDVLGAMLAVGFLWFFGM